MEASRAAPPARPAPAAQAPARLRPAADRALEQLYDEFARDVYQYALALLTNPADAEDATQTTFLNAYRALQRGDRPHRPHNWLIAITHNVCRMRWRQADHRPREVALDEAPEPAAFEREQQPNLNEVLSALGRLSFNQRAAIVMRELEGRSCKEIAETLGVTLGAVEALLFRARRRLQLDRGAIGVIGTVPLPGSPLLSALGLGGGTGGSAAAGAGAAAGTNLALKAALLVALGAVATGAVGVAKQIQHLRSPTAGKVQLVAAPASVTRAASKSTTHRRTRNAGARAAHRGQPGQPARTQTQTQSSAPAGPAGDVTQPAAPPAPQQLPIQPPELKLPQLPQLPQLPALPPPLQPPQVQLPSLPVRVPGVPPAPPLPPLPPLNP